MFKAISIPVFLCLLGLATAARPAPVFPAATTRSANTQAAPQDAAELERLRDLAKQGQDDPEPWREYAEALEKSGDAKGAAKAFGEAVRRYVSLYKAGGGPRRVEADEDAARYRAQWAARLGRAPETIQRYIRLGGAKGFERQQLEAIAGHAGLLNETDPARRVYRSDELDRKARILAKPQPAFTGDTGLVRLRAILAADGKVKHIYVQQGGTGGLAEASVEAARGIRFEPATKDGRPVAQFIILEYRADIR